MDRFAVCGCSRDVLKEDLIGPATVIEREEGEAVRLDAGDGAHALFDLLLKTDGADLVAAVRKIGGAGVESEDERVVRIEAGIDVIEMNQAANEESGHHHQQHRERDLPDDEGTSHNAACGYRRT